MEARLANHQRRAPAGRPEATSHAAIEQAAFRLFADRGFEATTMDDIAEVVGVSRRTLFRYYASKNDIPWGQFDRTLDGFRTLFDTTPPDLSLRQAVHRAVVAFNDFPPDADPPHEQRMRLILETPSLQAHSVLRYEQWRRVIADYVAAREALDADDLLPRVIGHASLALALSAYEEWLRTDGLGLPALLDRVMGDLAAYFTDSGRLIRSR